MDDELSALERSGAHPAAIAVRTQELTEALAQIADADGDIDAFRAAQERRVPHLRDNIAIAHRLLTAGRAAEAMQVLEEVPAGGTRLGWPYAAARIGVLEALGHRDEAQAERWARFWTSLSVEALRGFLKRLPDFEDVEREEAALAHVEQHRDATAALGFLMAWPDHRRATALVRRRAPQLDGGANAALITAAEQLAHRDPLAATLLFRLTVDAALSQGDGNARVAKTLMECASLSAAVTDWDGRPDHQAYVARLRARYGRQWKFWRRVASAT